MALSPGLCQAAGLAFSPHGLLIIHFTWFSIVQSLVLCFGARLGWVGPLGSRLKSKKQKVVGLLQGVSGSREAQLGCVRGGGSGPGMAVEGVS